MTFLETVAQARALLESNGRISLSALARELELEDDALDERVEELVAVHESGEGEAGVAEMQQAMVELAGAGRGAPTFLCSLAAGLWRVGRHDEALGALGGGIALAKQQGQHYYDAELHRLRAEILLDVDGNAAPEAEVEALFGQSLEIARRQEAKGFELRAATSLARLWQRQGKRDAALALLAPLYAWFTGGGGKRDLIDAKALLEELGVEATSL